MDDSEKEHTNPVGRRHFLKSLFSLTAVAETEGAASAAKPKTGGGVSFFWANLGNGQIAFPTGMAVPSGPPGSLMKLVSAAALMEAGLYSRDQTIECRGQVQVNKHSYKCLVAHGNVDLIRAIGLSCNVFFAQALQKLSPAAVLDYAARFGFNEPVAGYAAGKFPTHATTDSVEYGLGLAADLAPNALQLMRMVALVGLNGHVPALHNAAEDPAAEKTFSLELRPSTWSGLQQGMRIAEREGTAHKLDPQDTLKIAAKTGTAPHGKSFQSWIAGYFPFDKPKYAFCLRASSGTSQERAVPEAHGFLFAAPWP
jgi:cell division protein FtsI/penicillin-binding protein 2